jgi:hypothetical protein
MPLSQEEQRTLDEIERALRADDPKFAADGSLERLERERQHHVFTAGAAFLLAMVLLVVGLIASQIQLGVGVTIGVIGFVAMVGSIQWLLLKVRR